MPPAQFGEYDPLEHAQKMRQPDDPDVQRLEVERLKGEIEALETNFDDLVSSRALRYVNSWRDKAVEKVQTTRPITTVQEAMAVMSKLSSRASSASKTADDFGAPMNASTNSATTTATSAFDGSMMSRGRNEGKEFSTYQQRQAPLRSSGTYSCSTGNYSPIESTHRLTNMTQQYNGNRASSPQQSTRLSPQQQQGYQRQSQYRQQSLTTSSSQPKQKGIDTSNFLDGWEDWDSPPRLTTTVRFTNSPGSVEALEASWSRAGTTTSGGSLIGQNPPQSSTAINEQQKSALSASFGGASMRDFSTSSSVSSVFRCVKLTPSNGELSMVSRDVWITRDHLTWGSSTDSPSGAISLRHIIRTAVGSIAIAALEATLVGSDPFSVVNIDRSTPLHVPVDMLGTHIIIFLTGHHIVCFSFSDPTLFNELCSAVEPLLPCGIEYGEL